MSTYIFHNEAQQTVARGLSFDIFELYLNAPTKVL